MRRSPWLSGAALALLCLGMLALRVLWSSAALYREGEGALKGGRLEEAVRSLGRAARMDVPLFPSSARARERLREIAEGAEGRGDRALAILAYRELRSAILATRSVYTPAPALLARANERLAGLMAAAEEADPELGKEDLAARRAWHARALARDEMPQVGFTLLALLGAGLFIGAGFGLALRGVGEDGRLLRRPALRMLLLCLAGFVMMALGLWRA